MNLVRNIRITNDDPFLALRDVVNLDSSISNQDVAEFVIFLRELASQSGTFDSFRTTDRIAEIAGAPVSWTRHKYRLYPAYTERIQVMPPDQFESEKAALKGPAAISAPEWLIVRPADWCVHSSVIAPGRSNYRENSGFWNSVVAGNLGEVFAGSAAPDISGGLSFNILEIDPQSIASGDIDLRPLVLHSLAPDGNPCDKDNPKAQAAIVNAFWQTFWATGARRAERGSTFPVAFMPVDRTNATEFAPPWDCRQVATGRTLYGRTAILAWIIEALTAARALQYEIPAGRFVLNVPEKCDISEADIQLALDELNRCGFVDRFTGTNRDLLGREGTADDLPVRTRIRRVIPYSGCAFLSEVVNESAALQACGKIQDFDGEILAATNSTFFLNFPEEYATLHSAMNDPVALLVENGVTHQVHTMKRAIFAMDVAGNASITTEAANRITVAAGADEKALESRLCTYDGSDRPFAENMCQASQAYSKGMVDAVVIGNSVVETFTGQTQIPSNGIIVQSGTAPNEAITTTQRPSIRATIPNVESQGTGIRHAFAVGPLLIEDGRIVPLEQSKEDFQPIVVESPPSFEQTCELTRIQLPPEFMHCEKRGVPPTRFPYDWNRTRAPRTAIGVRSDGHILLVVVDGRADLPHSVGVTLAELAQLMRNLDCTGAINLDGGGSSVMFVHDPRAHDFKLREDLRPGVVNLPSDLGGVERLLPVPLVIYRRRGRA